MVPLEKIVKGNWIIFDPKMMHPHFSGSILQMLILLNQRAKSCKKIILTVLIALAQLERVIFKFCSKKWTKIYMKNMLLVIVVKNISLGS